MTLKWYYFNGILFILCVHVFAHAKVHREVGG